MVYIEVVIDFFTTSLHRTESPDVWEVGGKQELGHSIVGAYSTRIVGGFVFVFADGCEW